MNIILFARILESMKYKMLKVNSEISRARTFLIKEIC